MKEGIINEGQLLLKQYIYCALRDEFCNPTHFHMAADYGVIKSQFLLCTPIISTGTVWDLCFRCLLGGWRTTVVMPE